LSHTSQTWLDSAKRLFTAQDFLAQLPKTTLTNDHNSNISDRSGLKEVLVAIAFHISNNVDLEFSVSSENTLTFLNSVLDALSAHDVSQHFIGDTKNFSVLSLLENLFRRAWSSLMDPWTSETVIYDLALEMIQRLLEMGYAPNQPIYHHFRHFRPREYQGLVYPLQEAAYLGDEVLVRLLAPSYLDVDVSTDTCAKSPLEISLRHRKSSITDLLIERGASPGKLGPEVLADAIKSGRTDILENRRLGIELDLRIPRGDPYVTETTALTCAAHYRRCDKDSIGELAFFELVHKLVPMDINAPAENWTNVAIAAAARGNNDIIKHLIELGVDTSRKNEYGISPVHAAIAEGHRDTWLLLLQLGGAKMISEHPSLVHLAAIKVNREALDDLVAAEADVNIIIHHGTSEFNALCDILNKAEDWQSKSRSLSLRGCSSISPLKAITLCTMPHAFYEPHTSWVTDCILCLLNAGAHYKRGILPFASRRGKLELVRAVLQCGADVNEKPSNGLSCLRIALQYGHAEIAHTLLSCGLGTTLHGGEVILALENVSQPWPLVERLIGIGADVNAPFQGGTLLEATINTRDPVKIDWALKHDDQKYHPRELCAAVQLAVEVSDVSIVERVLDRRRCRTPGDLFESTAVAIAANGGAENIIDLLRTYIPNLVTFCKVPHFQSFQIPLFRWTASSVSTPLIGAIKRGDETLVSKLLDAGFQADRSCLTTALAKKAVSTTRAILKSGPVLPNLSPYLDSPLTTAVKNNDSHMVQRLLEHGEAKYFGGCEYSNSCGSFIAAVERGNLNLINILLENGADVNGPLQDIGGSTPLVMAAAKGDIDITKLLLDHDPPARINAHRALGYGRTALEAAAECGRLDVAYLLLSYGAKTIGSGQRQYLRAIKLAERKGHHAVSSMLRSHRQWTPDDEQRFEEDEDLLDDDGIAASECSSDCGYEHSFPSYRDLINEVSPDSSKYESECAAARSPDDEHMPRAVESESATTDFGSLSGSIRADPGQSLPVTQWSDVGGDFFPAWDNMTGDSLNFGRNSIAANPWVSLDVSNYTEGGPSGPSLPQDD
jgi:ankyrin repeat protein